ncbi:MAG: N-acetylglucosamine-6-phosphate deacetylase [Roseburia sp.]|nr:N-acetylglucosamine-6-phosphate deacetylase [Roseburia sp.]
MKIKNASVFCVEQGFAEKDVYMQDGCFVEESRYRGGDGSQVIDGEGLYLIPGLVDIHFHGCGGADFSDGTPEALRTISACQLARGVTSICPATMTLPEERLAAVCENAVEYLEESAGQPARAALRGIHLEGPFIAGEKRGAQNARYIRPADVALYRRLQQAAHGLIRLVTLAPETAGAEAFIRELHGEVHLSVGHTACDYACARRAFAAGADHVTHLFNAMEGFGHRAPGVLAAAFDAGNVMPELICDGIHVDAAAVRVAFRLFGGERMILISDSMRAAGMPDGDYTLGGQRVHVAGKLATLDDGTIAGSVTNLMDGLRMAVAIGIPLETAVRCASYNPARAIGVDSVCGSIDAGKDADCVLLSKKGLEIQKVFRKGVCVENVGE